MRNEIELYKLIGKKFTKEELENEIESMGYDILGDFEYYWNVINIYDNEATETMIKISDMTRYNGLIKVVDVE